MKLFEFFLLFALAVFPFGQLPTIPFDFIGFTEVKAHLLDVFVFFTVFLWGMRLIFTKSKFPRTPLNKPIFLFFLLAVVSLVFNNPLLGDRELVVSFLYLLRFALYVGIFWVVFTSCQKEGKNLEKWLNFLIIVGTTSGIFTLFQYFFLPDVRFLECLSWDPHYYRAIGAFLDPSFLGIILVLTLILIAYQIFQNKNIWFGLPGVITYSALAFTYSRSSFLAFIITAGIFSYFKKAPKIFLSAVLLLLVTIFLLPRPGGEGVKLERQSTITARIINWQQAFLIFRDHPLFGVGFNSYRYAQSKYGFLEEDERLVSHAGAGADSSFLFVLATTGILGFLAYLWLWVKILNVNNLLISASGIALIVHSFFSNSLFYPWVLLWFWTLLGSVLASSPVSSKKLNT